MDQELLENWVNDLERENRNLTIELNYIKAKIDRFELFLDKFLDALNAT